MQTKGILLNYEGTIDTNGQHWGAILWHKFQKYISGLELAVYNNAYAYSETVLAANQTIKPTHVFFDVLTHKITQQFNYLSSQGYQLDYTKVHAIANECNHIAVRTLKKTTHVLKTLSDMFPVVLVSNFYGNLNTVLTEFGIKQYFIDVVESTAAQTQSNTEIYERAISRLGYLPEECVAVGDSYNRDILPSKAVGCKTVWLNVLSWEEWGIDELGISDEEIRDISQLPGLLENWGSQANQGIPEAVAK